MPVPPQRKQFDLSPIHVELFGENEFATSVGKFGRAYSLKFIDLMNLIKSRQGFQQKRLEYKGE